MIRSFLKSIKKTDSTFSSKICYGIVKFKIKNHEKKKLKFLTTSHLSPPPTRIFKTTIKTLYEEVSGWLIKKDYFCPIALSPAFYFQVVGTFLRAPDLPSWPTPPTRRWKWARPRLNLSRKGSVMPVVTMASRKPPAQLNTTLILASSGLRGAILSNPLGSGGGKIDCRWEPQDSKVAGSQLLDVPFYNNYYFCCLFICNFKMIFYLIDMAASDWGI